VTNVIEFPAKNVSDVLKDIGEGQVVSARFRPARLPDGSFVLLLDLDDPISALIAEELEVVGFVLESENALVIATEIASSR
jgi:hypothetical protein